VPENEPIWVRVADALHFVDNPEAVAQIADRFETGYAPAIRDARSRDARDKATLALYRYLATGATPRKPWSLPKGDPQRALDALLALLINERKVQS